MFKFNFPAADEKAVERYGQTEPRSALLSSMNDVLDGCKGANEAIIAGEPKGILTSLLKLSHIVETAIRVALRYYVGDVKALHKAVVKDCSDRGWYAADTNYSDYIEEGR